MTITYPAYIKDTTDSECSLIVNQMGWGGGLDWMAQGNLDEWFDFGNMKGEMNTHVPGKLKPDY